MHRRDLMLLVSCSGQSVSVSWRGHGLDAHVFGNRGAAEATVIGDTWWVNRVLVQGEGTRGRGIGGHMLDVLKEAIAKAGGKSVSVCPGGYSGRTEDQFRFYEAHGFNRVNDDPSLLICDLTEI